jgi:hypothetical protein
MEEQMVRVMVKVMGLGEVEVEELEEWIKLLTDKEEGQIIIMGQMVEIVVINIILFLY